MRAAAAWLCLALAACGERPATVAPHAASAAASGAGDTIVAGTLRVTAIGQREGDVLHVRRLEVRQAGDSATLQVIDGLQTDTPWPRDTPGLEAPDMNFDGHPDLRLIEFRAAGPNTPWKHWLYDPGSGRFVASEALDALSPTGFDAVRKRVIVDWRDRADRAGQDVYAWQGGRLERVTIAP